MTLADYLASLAAEGKSDVVIRIVGVTCTAGGPRVTVYARPQQLNEVPPYSVTTPTLEVTGDTIVWPRA